MNALPADFVATHERITARIARTLAPAGGLLECRCGERVQVSQVDVRRFLDAGWPQHCGYTMRFEAR